MDPVTDVASVSSRKIIFHTFRELDVFNACPGYTEQPVPGATIFTLDSVSLLFLSLFFPSLMTVAATGHKPLPTYNRKAI